MNPSILDSVYVAHNNLYNNFFCSPGQRLYCFITFVYDLERITHWHRFFSNRHIFYVYIQHTLTKENRLNPLPFIP